MSRRRVTVAHLIPAIVERDGGNWNCHYCGKTLIPTGIERGTEPYYMLKIVRILPPQCQNARTLEEVEYYYGLVASGDLLYWECFMALNPEYDHAIADHVVPFSKGGSNHIDNLVVACVRCNQRKAAKSYQEYMAVLGKGLAS